MGSVHAFLVVGGPQARAAGTPPALWKTAAVQPLGASRLRDCQERSPRQKTEWDQWKYEQLRETSERYNPQKSWTEERDPEYRRPPKVNRMSLLEEYWTQRNEWPESEPRYREWKESTEAQRQTKNEQILDRVYDLVEEVEKMVEIIH